MEELQKQLDGFGGRLNRVEQIQGRHDERITDNKESIVGIRTDYKDLKKSIDAAVWKVIIAVAVPTCLVLYQLIGKH